MTKRDAATALWNAIAFLPKGKQDFANSLLDQLSRKGDLSQNQWHWVVKLTDMANAPKAAAVQVNAGPVVELLARAAEKMQRLPAICLDSETHGILRLSLAGARARVPGSVDVKSHDKRDAEGRRLWFGRIHADGTFEARRGLEPHEGAAIVHALARFCADPAAEASRFGHQNHWCCFCARDLTDPRSKSVGYGPICAEKFSLPWGEMPAKPALTCTAA